MPLRALLAVAIVLSNNAYAQAPAHRQLQQLVDAHSAQFIAASHQIWEYAELGYHEEKSSALLQRELEAAGFTLQSGVADEPTGFVASWGHGKPVIAILGEFDALPGLSQAAVPDRSPVVIAAPGHGCGHNLLGSGAALAAVAVKEYLEKNRMSGTLRYYGTPAEEGGSGKIYMVRAGLFRDVDVVLHWHPSNVNVVANGGALAVISAKFTFHGAAAHAALAPDRGRSALDAIMLMGNGIEFMREHVPSNTRIHYIITNGGAAVNIVPDTATMQLMARSPSNTTLDGIWSRIVKIAQGAALMTETTMEVKVDSTDANIVPNNPLAHLAQRDLEEVGGFRYTAEEQRFAAEIRKTLPPEAGAAESPETVLPLTPIDPNSPAASTDVGDVSWNVPTIGFGAATFAPGVAAHTWQATACAGMSIGQRGMLVAAKALALTAADLFADPKLVADAKADFDNQTKGKTYRSQIPEGAKPPLEYRKN